MKKISGAPARQNSGGGHDYTGIDKFSTFEIIKISVPKTIHSLSNIIRKGLLQNQFSQADLDLAKTSPYLKHVNFAEI